MAETTAQPQLQSSLGRVAGNSTKQERNWNDGYLALGKVLKVHHKRNTADVTLLKSSDTFMSETSQEGKHSCRIGVGLAGVDAEFREPYGEIIPLQKNMIVLVAFLKNSKEKPVIIRAFHDISEDDGSVNYDNILPTDYPITTETIGSAEMYRYTNISRVQDVFTVDGVGNLEISSHTKSFIIATINDIDEESFDYEDLHTKNKRNGKTVYIPERKSFPLKYLAVFRDNYNDGETNFLRCFVDATKTAFKMLKQQVLENKSTSIEITENGEIKTRRDAGETVTEVTVQENGDIEVKREGSTTTTLTIDDSGVHVKTDDSMELSAEKSLNLKCQSTSVELTPSEINLKGSKVNLN